MSNSPLVSYTRISPNKTSPRTHAIDTITIHCVVGQCGVEALGAEFAKKSRSASSNYGIGYDGKIGMYVEEKDRSWCSSNYANDNRAITIECASDNYHPYAINDKVYAALIELCADICKRNNIKELKWKADKSLVGQPDKQNVTVHRWFANKACPGQYIYERLGKIAEEVNAKLGVVTEPVKPEPPKVEVPKAETPKVETTVPDSTIYRVQTGAFRNKEYADNYYNKIKAAGFDVYMIKTGGFYKVQVGAYKNKTNATKMKDKLTAAGFDAIITTKSGDSVQVSAKKSVTEIAKEVIQGKWGVGTDRKNRLSKAGYDYAEVQKKVNELL